MANFSKNDVLDAITIYLKNNDRPCPAHYLINKFGEDVSDTILSLKKDGSIVGKRGRNGGIVFPDAPVANVVANPVIVDDEAIDLLAKMNAAIEAENNNSITEQDADSDSAEAPF